jgi:hypothetical protein
MSSPAGALIAASASSDTPSLANLPIARVHGRSAFQRGAVPWPLRPDEDIGAVAGLSGRRHADEARNADVNRSCPPAPRRRSRQSPSKAPVSRAPRRPAKRQRSRGAGSAGPARRRRPSFPDSGRNSWRRTPPPRSPPAALTTAAVAEKPGWPPYEDGGRRRFDCPLIPPRSRQRPALVRRAASAPAWRAGPPNGRSRTPDRRGSWCRSATPLHRDR